MSRNSPPPAPCDARVSAAPRLAPALASRPKATPLRRTLAGTAGKVSRLGLVAAGLALLAACGTPQEQCIDRNLHEVRTLQSLLREVEGNLDRGYAWDERPVTATEWRECRDVVRGKDGKARVIDRPCLRDVTEMERFRVPIDPAAETRKRDGLRARIKTMTPRAEAATRACRAAYPE